MVVAIVCPISEVMFVTLNAGNKTISHGRVSYIYIRIVILNLIGIHSLVFSLEGRAWQEPEPSHATGMALVHCILGKFLGVVCHGFPPAFRRSHFSGQVPPYATTRKILAAKGGTVGEKDVR